MGDDNVKLPSLASFEGDISDYIPSWLVRRIEVLVGSTKIKDILIALCSMNRIHDVEEVLLYTAGNSSRPQKLILYPIDDVVEECVCKDKGDRLVIVFKTKIKKDVVGVTLVLNPLHLRPATLKEITDDKSSSSGIEIKTI